MKTCSGCGETLPFDAFNRCKSKPDGRQSRCKPCRKAHYAANREAVIDRVRAHYAENREVIAERHRAYRRTNSEAIAESKHAWYAANREAITARRRAHRAANRDAVNERKRAYHQANPHVEWVADYRKRARRYGFVPVVERFTRDDLIARYGDACAHCGGTFDELDHYPIPVSQGGPHTIENCKPACTPCNQRSWKTDAA